MTIGICVLLYVVAAAATLGIGLAVLHNLKQSAWEEQRSQRGMILLSIIWPLAWIIFVAGVVTMKLTSRRDAGDEALEPEAEERKLEWKRGGNFICADARGGGIWATFCDHGITARTVRVAELARVAMNERPELLAQRDELLAELKGLVEACQRWDDAVRETIPNLDVGPGTYLDGPRAVIAKVEGNE